MQLQTAQSGGDDAKLTGLNPELPVVPQPESPPVKKPELSSSEADREAIAQATIEKVTTAEGNVFPTLRKSPEPIPTELNTEKDPVQRIKEEVEMIMQADLVNFDKKANKLTGIFTEIPPDRQTLFKAEGERLANEITEMIQSGKFDPGEAQDELVRWLKIIPDVNQPWIMQMATIKKDKILALVNQIHRDRNMLN
ncbi:MAG: hypothetical protein P1P90_05350 [Patescibacteria group bacterium]|nr:hypothetical protein [Patescibacteria group bacterium]